MEKGKGLYWLLSGLLIVVLAGEAVLGYATLTRPFTSGSAPASTAANVGAPAARLITVSSEGSVDATPDVAYLTAGVETRGQTAREAMDLNSTAMQRVIEALTATGVRQEDLRTPLVSLYPIMGQTSTDSTGPEQIRAYAAQNSVSITINDIAQSGNLLDAAIQAGATTSNGIQFGVKDDSKPRDEALRRATTAARARAEVVARQLGVTLGPLQTLVEESTSSSPVPKGLGGAGAAPIQPGQLTFTAQVQATYSYR